MPKVSVIIPTHNRPELLKRAINSVLAQTYQDFEIIVVDDGDISAEDIVKSFSDSRIRFIRHETPHRGGSATRNTGIKNATGEFIAFLDDDDEWKKEKLAEQVAVLDNNKEVGLCFCLVEAIDGFGRKLYISKTPKEGRLSPYRDLLKKAFIWTSSMVVRKSLLQPPFLFDETLPKNQEWDLTLRLAKTTDFYAISKPLVKLHIHGDQMGGFKNLPARIEGHKVFIQKHWNDYRRNKKFFAQRYYEIGIMCKESGRILLAGGYFIKAFVTSPNSLFFRSLLSLLKDVYSRIRQNLVVRVLSWPFRKIYRSKFLTHYRDRQAAFRTAEKILGDLKIDSQKIKEILRAVKKKGFMRHKFSFGHAGDLEVIMLYTLVRVLKPNIVVETGVASGRSSWAILDALKDNNDGKLYSIDLPQFFSGKEPEKFMTKEGKLEFKGFVPIGYEPGWLVPQNLRERWELILGKSQEKLPPLLENLGSVDIFYHDSEHSYENMMFEFRTVWPYLKEGGFLLSDDIKWNEAFDVFLSEIDAQFFVKSGSFGLIRKLR